MAVDMNDASLNAELSDFDRDLQPAQLSSLSPSAPRRSAGEA